MSAAPIEVRLWSKVAKGGDDDCWIWTAFRNADGYGKIAFRGRADAAHRVAWTITNGEIPHGMVIRHKCDNPSCVNINHLEIGTHADNARDRSSRNRSRTKIPISSVEKIRKSTGNCRDIGGEYGVSAAMVSLIRNNKRRKCYV